MAAAAVPDVEPLSYPVSGPYRDQFNEATVNTFVKTLREDYHDKTLMLQHLQNTSDHSIVKMITAPTGFCKTVNMDMAHKFFQLPVNLTGELLTTDRNSELFNDKDILTSGAGTEAFGQFPVVHLRCKTASSDPIPVRDHESMRHFCLTMLHEAFLQHHYVNARNTSQDVRNWCEEDLIDAKSDEEIGQALVLLFSCLCQHFQHPLQFVLLVDDFDSPLMTLLVMKLLDGGILDTDYHDAKDLYMNIFLHWYDQLKAGQFCQNHPKCSLRFALFTGVFSIKLPGDLGADMHTFEFLSENKYTSFYGADRGDIRQVSRRVVYRRHRLQPFIQCFAKYRSRYCTFHMTRFRHLFQVLHRDIDVHSDFYGASIRSEIFTVLLPWFMDEYPAAKLLWSMLQGRHMHVAIPFQERDTIRFVENILTSPYSAFDELPYFLLHLGLASYTWPGVPAPPSGDCECDCCLLDFGVVTRRYRLKLANEFARYYLYRYVNIHYLATYNYTNNHLQCVAGAFRHLLTGSPDVSFGILKTHCEELFKKVYPQHLEIPAHVAFKQVYAILDYDCNITFADTDAYIHMNEPDVWIYVRVVLLGDSDKTQVFREFEDSCVIFNDSGVGLRVFIVIFVENPEEECTADLEWKKYTVTDEGDYTMWTIDH